MGNQKECVQINNLLYCKCLLYVTTPGVTWLPPRCKHDKILAFAPFTDRGCSYTVKGVILICLVDHITFPAVNGQ